MDADSPFDTDAVSSVSDEYGIDPERLSALVAAHQANVADLPGVEELVYEWRKHYDDALVERTAAAYYLAVPEWVWPEFAEALDADDDEVAALVDLHRRTVASRTDADERPEDGRAYVVLDRRDE